MSAWQEALRAGISRARTLDRPVVVASRQSIAERTEFLELYAAAETRGQRRFFAARPQDGFELLGLGITSEILAPEPDAGAAVMGRALTLLHEADPDALLLGGYAFLPRSASERDPVWRSRANARFTLPALVLTREHSEQWLTRIALAYPEDSVEELTQRSRQLAMTLLEAAPPSQPSHVRLSAGTDVGDAPRYEETAAEIIAAIRRGEAQKVVLARTERFALEGHLSTSAVLQLLCEAHPSCFIFAEGLAHDTFLGATPEGLIRRRGDRVESSAVAGTVARANTSSEAARLADTLCRSPKEQAEHAFVVRAIEEGLAGFCRGLEVPAAPSLLDTGNVQHLHTLIRGRLRQPTHVLELVACVHPTPAIAGTPRERALELIRKHEHFDRGAYAGPIGYFDARGDGEFVVALRCGLIADDALHLFAGAGLVADSDPRSEAAETTLKLRTLREAVEAACRA